MKSIIAAISVFCISCFVQASDSFQPSIDLKTTRCEALGRSHNGLHFVRYQVMENRENYQFPWDCPVTDDFKFSIYSRTSRGWIKTDYQTDLKPLKVNFPKLLINAAQISEDGQKIIIQMNSEYTPWIAVGAVAGTEVSLRNFRKLWIA